MPYVGHLVAQFNEVRADLAEIEQYTDIRSVVDHIFPDGYGATRELRILTITVLEENEIEDLAQFMSELISAITAPEVPSEIEEVRIMSLHKSKGLSAPVTIIAGCVEGLLPVRPDPSLSPQGKAAHLEEQRRLFYVGVSRVKAVPEHEKPGTLIMTYSQQMPLATAMGAGISPAGANYGTASLLASRFIAELGPSAPQPIAG